MAAFYYHPITGVGLDPDERLPSMYTWDQTKWIYDPFTGERIVRSVARYVCVDEKPHATGIEAMVCADITKRQKLGIAKYGQTVLDNPLELNAWLQHAYEEALDLAVYLRRAIQENAK